MYIANPIYDVVFKYLMEDAKIAKILISSIIGMEVKSLRFLPQEFIGNFEKTKIKGKSTPQLHKERLGLTVYRLDFSAKIKTPEGEKQVIIELQKAKFQTDIMRFRAYLGRQFSNKDNTQKIVVNGHRRKIGLPIMSIYFLGHKLDHTEAGAIKVGRIYTNMITGELITQKEDFIESLTVDSYVVQIPFLTDKRRNELEILLQVFDQSTAVDPEHHVLNMEEKDFPPKFRPIIRKLHQAVQSPEMKQQMEMEDGIIDELEDLERELEEKDMIIEEKDMLIAENKVKAEAEKAKAEAEKAKVEAEKAKVEAEKAKVEAENELLRKQIADLLKKDT